MIARSQGEAMKGRAPSGHRPKKEGILVKMAPKKEGVLVKGGESIESFRPRPKNEGILASKASVR